MPSRIRRFKYFLSSVFRCVQKVILLTVDDDDYDNYNYNDDDCDNYNDDDCDNYNYDDYDNYNYDDYDGGALTRNSEITFHCKFLLL